MFCCQSTEPEVKNELKKEPDSWSEEDTSNSFFEQPTVKIERDISDDDDGNSFLSCYEKLHC